MEIEIFNKIISKIKKDKTLINEELYNKINNMEII